MSEFKIIETQEDLDRIINARLARQKETLEKQFGDYDQIKTRNAELENEVTSLKTAMEETSAASKTHEQLVADLESKIAGYEKASIRQRVALQNGLPIEFADRLAGEDEESIKADAERLSSFFKPSQPVAPLKSVEPNVQEDEDADLRKMLQNLTNRGE
ncbi:capsid assembly scaffolding protein Gp46 family protein [Vagococcus xieshaowenii]|uniref:DUF4355 domain-containing protein n=1 Tax=Vagococcus xieshaowenii TaxID=2562451 RepID=A0AAJ5EEM1_9ENTE|nr:DUF4355 domain-containing protein [Vagococcus xieshaowenii]QCA28250.1 DUF4355 domain-containing protein [Vagococcus xieshaowenii]TFZ41904.1 DUF4355 domain-containing protein [Vagococcus xieshaowenii]